MGAWRELWHERECTGPRHENVSYRDVVTTGAAHSHDVPSIDDFAAFLGEIRHHCLRLTLCPRLVSSHYRCRRGDPVGVLAVAHEGRAPPNAIPALARD